ncbi:DUF262 domain-containing protein [Ruegeria pomeroyi]|nr:DUF262 domain-containing protein [Ruegeria pomeroyi]
MMENQSIREILEAVTRGQIRIPAFQRGFVWEPDRIAYLMDSIYKGYPFGSLMFWRTKEQLKFDRKLGPFDLPQPKEDYPVDYVLDGQQRVTSLFGTFQTELEPSEDSNWLDIYFDMTAPEAAQDTQFVALTKDEVDPAIHFPLKALFDTTGYRAATKDLEEKKAATVDDMQARFKEAKIPVQITKTEDKETVAIIFERVNRQGVELDTLQLLSAWTWSEEFQLADQFEELANELRPFGFADVGGDTDLLLRCTSAILAGDASPGALMGLNGAAVRDRFDEVTNGVKYAVDYVKKQLNVHSLNNLPFVTLLVPLAVFFAVPGNKERQYTNDEREIINKWFWRACFSRRYSAGVLKNLKTDIENMSALRDGKASNLGNFSSPIDPLFFVKANFVMSNVNSKSFILMLASKSPRSFISGQHVDLAKTLKAANRSEFHHMMPKDFVKKKFEAADENVNCLANICFLARADNRTLGGAAPSQYRKHMPQDAGKLGDILESSLASELLFGDDFPKFIEERSNKLAVLANKLCQNG